MPGSKKTIGIGARLWDRGIFGIFLLFYFCAFLWLLDAKLFYQAEQPVFFFDATFGREFLSYPGGLNELLSRFLAQFFYHAWHGALLLALAFGLVALATKLVLKQFSNDRPHRIAPWVPTLFLFALYHNYQMPLTVAGGFLLVLAATDLYMRLHASAPFRAALFCVLYLPLYYVVAGPVLLFAVLAILSEITRRRQFVLPVIYAAAAAIFPFIAENWLFILAAKSTYLKHLGFEVLDVAQWAVWGLWLILPAKIGFDFVRRKISAAPKAAGNKTPTGRLASVHPATQLATKFALLLLCLCLVGLKSFDPAQKALLLADYHARHGHWQKVLDTVQKSGLTKSYIGQFYLHRALYHTGRLCDALFLFPQTEGAAGLFMHESIRPLFPLQYSDLYYELGLINEAQHWAHEALSVTGDTPWNLQRLALVNVLKGENEAARLYLRLLQKTLCFKPWATSLLTALDSGNFSSAPEIARQRALMLKDDFIIIPGEPQACLENLLVANSANKMAFEYYMMSLLLDGQVGRFINRLPGSLAFNYAKTPRHFEEAILLYMLNSGKRDIPTPKTGLSPATLQTFQDYVKIVQKHNNQTAAYQELRKYENTYWFYATYVYRKDK